MIEKKNTMTDLVAELRKMESTLAVQNVIEDALAGEFHDFRNQKYICPKAELVVRLRKIGREDIAREVIEGDYDEEL